MKWIAQLTIAGMMLAGSAQAHAADWWWVEGDADANAALFIDADSVTHGKSSVSFHVQAVDRNGRSVTTVQQARCDTPAATTETAAMRRFACASIEERMKFAANLGSIGPSEAAQAIFSTPLPTAQGRAFRAL